MKFAYDKILHAAMGIGAVVVTFAAIVIAEHSVGAALALVSTAFGAFYEFQQWYRGEGQVEVWDAAATAAPGWAVWGAIEIFAQGA